MSATRFCETNVGFCSAFWMTRVFMGMSHGLGGDVSDSLKVSIEISSRISICPRRTNSTRGGYLMLGINVVRIKQEL